MLQLPKNINSRLIWQLLYVLSHKQFLSLCKILTLIWALALANKDIHPHLLALVEYQDDLINHTLLLPRNRVSRQHLKQLYAHLHRKFEWYWHFLEVWLFKELVSKDNLQYQLANPSSRLIPTTHMQKLPMSKPFLRHLSQLCVHHLQKFQKSQHLTWTQSHMVKVSRGIPLNLLAF